MANTLSVGVEMTERELLSTLERFGIRPVPAQGERFDPNLHQAMMEMEDANVPAGTVVLVMQAGYQIHDRLLRPALVGVSKGGPKAPQGEQVDTSA
jgi:molecular chaperone GrpE